MSAMTIARALDKMINLVTLYTDPTNPKANQQFEAELYAHMAVSYVILKDHKEHRAIKNKKKRDSSKRKQD